MPQGACLAHNGSLCMGIPLTYLPTPPQRWDPGSHSSPVWLHSQAKFPLQGCGAQSQPGNLWAQMRLRIYNPNPPAPTVQTTLYLERQQRPVSKLQRVSHDQRYWSVSFRNEWQNPRSKQLEQRRTALISSCQMQECCVRVTELCPSLHFLTQLGSTSFPS